MPRSKAQAVDKTTRYDKYEAECRRMTRPELQRELAHQSSVVSGNVVGSGIATLAIPLTMGLSVVALGGTGPAIYIARKKRAIAQKILNEPETDGYNYGPAYGRTQQVPVEVNSFASSSQLPSYTAQASRASLSLLREPSRRGEKEVYVPQPQPEGPPAYSEMVESSKEGRSGPRVHFAPPPGPPPGQPTQSTSSNPFSDTQDKDDKPDRPSTPATDSATDVQSERPSVDRSATVASSIYGARDEQPSVSLIDAPVLPFSSRAARQSHANINEAFAEDLTSQTRESVVRYDSIAGANPFMSRMDSVVAPVRS